MIMKMAEIRQAIAELYRSQGYEVVPHSSTVSWSYPGQFCYCLNEEFIWERYGTVINIERDVHFNKTQIAIRWDDFVKHFAGSAHQNAAYSRSHLATFDMASVMGGNLIASRQRSSDHVRRTFEGLFDFLVSSIGLKKENFEISYFGGGHLSELGSNARGEPLFNFDYFFPSDLEGYQQLLALGFSPKQLRADISRDSFLILHWTCGVVAPWGYRNEINYRTEDGVVDIATIEHLTFRPLIQDGQIVGVEPWDRDFIISGLGLERLSLVTEQYAKIQDIDTIAPLFAYALANVNADARLICETVRTYHRVFADTAGDMSDFWYSGRNRRKKYNKLRNILCTIPNQKLREMLQINAHSNPWYFDELSPAIEPALEDLCAYPAEVRGLITDRKIKHQTRFQKVGDRIVLPRDVITAPVTPHGAFSSSSSESEPSTVLPINSRATISQKG
jgi:hypothetical protein